MLGGAGLEWQIATISRCLHWNKPPPAVPQPPTPPECMRRSLYPSPGGIGLCVALPRGVRVHRCRPSKMASTPAQGCSFSCTR